MSTVFIPQKSSAEISIYPHNSDPITFRPRGESVEGSSSYPQLVSVQTEKNIGMTGTWSAVVKVPRPRVREWEESISDGDWVDIVFTRGGRRYHVMRGMIEGVDPVTTIGASGAEVLAYQLAGFDHQAVFDKTRVWFSTYSEENIFGGAALRASTLVGRIFGIGGVRETISGILYGFLKELGGYGRSLWSLPAQMPGGGSYFGGSLVRLFDARVDDPARIATGASMMSFDNAALWQLAQEWCDAQFNELWCDLASSTPAGLGAVSADVIAEIGDSVPYDAYTLGDADALEPDRTRMGLFLRRRPFPTAEDPDGLEAGAWSRLKTATILPQEVEGLPLHRSGAERVNVIEVVPATLQEIAAASMSLLAPLVDVEDVKLRGVRPLSMRSRYHGDVTKGVSDNDLSETQRRMIRDWHCLNPQFFSGQLSLRTLRPGIRVGNVACVTRNPERLRGREAEDDLTFYVEQVKNTWRAGGAGRTELGVTRGYRGGDDALFAALSRARGRFTDPAASRALQAAIDNQGVA